MNTVEEEPRKKKRTRPPKFDYESEEFYQEIERLASAGYSDAAIAYNLAEKFGTSLSPQTFSEFKNEKTKKGAPTRRNTRITEALARGRTGILQAARSTYYQMALGQRKLKTIRKSAVSKRCPCCFENNMAPVENCPQCGGTGWYNLTDKVITEDTEMELAPNMQALATFLYNNDPEWRENILKQKREEAEAAAAASESDIPDVVNVRITYNQKSDLELQEKFKKPDE